MSNYIFKFFAILHITSYAVAQTEPDCLHHYCGCPPFLPDNPLRSIHFSKYPYGDHYAILGKAKELHCCFGGNFTTVLWYKDDLPYPWPSESKKSFPVLYAKNQSLILLDVEPSDEGLYKCVGSDMKQTVEHVSRLRVFSLPAFRHAPIWKEEPQDITVREGSKVTVDCAATVGPQYDTFRLQPVTSSWKTVKGKPLQGEDVKVARNSVDDEMVESIRLEFAEIKLKRNGKYSCQISNSYGTITKTVTIKVERLTDGSSLEDERRLKPKLVKLLERQLQIWEDFNVLKKDYGDDFWRLENLIIKSLKTET